VETPPLITHLETEFGRVECGWNPDHWRDSAIQVVEFRHGRIPGVIVLSTVGLSSFDLHSAQSGKRVRQELFVIFKNGQFDPAFAPKLDQIARESARSDRPVLRGEVLHKQGALLANRDFVALYATLPIYYPDTFWSFHDEEQGDTALGWLLPIKANEQVYIRENGWSAFEELMDGAKFDLFDLDRPSLAGGPLIGRARSPGRNEP
jgi:hypothetical protein